MSVIESICFFL